jgi:hypothetical protein
MTEEDAIMQGDCTHWMPPLYELRLEEVDRLVGMLNQLAVTLRRPYICVPEYRVSGFVALIKKAVGGSDWTKLPTDVSVCGILVIILQGHKLTGELEHDRPSLTLTTSCSIILQSQKRYPLLMGFSFALSLRTITFYLNTSFAQVR